MKRVNLLPPHLLEAQLRQRQQATGAMLLGIVGLLLAGWLVVAVWQVRVLDQTVIEVNVELQPLREQGLEYANLHQQHKQLTERLALIEMLHEPVPMPAMLALISQLAPPQLVLRSISIDVPEPPLALVTAVAASSRRTAANRQPQPIRPIQIQLDGMATQDVAIAHLVSALAEAGPFRNVRLADSREINFNGRQCHQFRVSMEVPVTRGSGAQSGSGLAQR